jgi:flavin-dependent dehydrogenase
MYDVAVIGAGPAGLMAAQTAAAKGLKIVVVEKQPDVSKIRRACCQQLVMDGLIRKGSRRNSHSFMRR